MYSNTSILPLPRPLETYQVGVKHILTFSLLYGLVGLSNPLLPTLEITLMHFTSHLANTVFYETVKLYLVAVQDLHRELKFPLKLNDMHRLQKVLTGIKHLTPPKYVGHFAITLTVLNSIHSYLKPELSYNLDHVMLWAAFSLAFLGVLRSNEFTCNGPFTPFVHLTSTDSILVPNSYSPSHMLVCIDQSKTDLFRQGHTITLSKGFATSLFSDGHERLSSPSLATIKPRSVCLRSTQTMAYMEQSHNTASIV